MLNRLANSHKLSAVTLAALGIVYGDIGTSPLYALRECFSESHGVPLSTDNILGVISLIIWSLILVVTVKYIVFVMRADHEGEGGILALMTLSGRQEQRGPRKGLGIVVILGLIGAAFLYGDGTITPAISVLSRWKVWRSRRLLSNPMSPSQPWPSYRSCFSFKVEARDNWAASLARSCSFGLGRLRFWVSEIFFRTRPFCWLSIRSTAYDS